jgi:hypothetical protein
MQEALLASVRSGLVAEDGAHAAITFEVGGEALVVALPAPELAGLITLCMGLSARAAVQRGADEVQVLPVDHWEVGRTTSNAMVLRLASDGGASLMFRFDRQQALELRDAVTMATAVPPREPLDARQVRERAAQACALQLAELVQLREQCRDHPAAVDLVDRCVALLADVNAANDEGRAAYYRNLVALVSAAREHLRTIEDLPPLEVERPPPAAG